MRSFLLDTYEGRDVVCIFPGSLYVKPAGRGLSLSQELGASCWLEAKRRWPMRACFMFLGSNSFKSYLMATRNFPVAYPSRKHPTLPAWELSYTKHLAETFYPEYDGEDDENNTLLLKPKQHSRGFKEFQDVQLPDDPDLRFFAERNPGFADGDKLMVLVPLGACGMLQMMLRVVRRKCTKLCLKWPTSRGTSG